MSKVKNEWKEVWYSWGGAGDYPTKFSGILYSVRNGGGLTSEIKESFDAYQSYFDHSNTRTASAVAYTIGEMRRRVECPKCQGKGKIELNHWFPLRCTHCKGTGKTWEYKK